MKQTKKSYTQQLKEYLVEELLLTDSINFFFFQCCLPNRDQFEYVHSSNLAFPGSAFRFMVVVLSKLIKSELIDRLMSLVFHSFVMAPICVVQNQLELILKEQLSSYLGIITL